MKVEHRSGNVQVNEKSEASEGVSNISSIIKRNSSKYLLGECVFIGEGIPDDIVLAAISICRRRFKEKDIVLLDVLDSAEEGEIGIVLTEEACFVWNEELQFSFAYEDIESVDYSDEFMEVYVSTKDEDYTIELSGDEDEHYPRKWYNLLLDIKEENYGD